MTSREPTPAELTEQARQLSAEAEHLLSVTTRRKETLLAAREQALKVTAEAESADGEIRATVDAGGMLIKLTVAPSAGRRDPAALAETILNVTQRAAGAARAAVRGIYDPLRHEGLVRDLPVLLPEPNPVTPPVRGHRTPAEDEPSYEDTQSVLRRRRR